MTEKPSCMQGKESHTFPDVEELCLGAQRDLLPHRHRAPVRENDHKRTLSIIPIGWLHARGRFQSGRSADSINNRSAHKVKSALRKRPIKTEQQKRMIHPSASYLTMRRLASNRSRHVSQTPRPILRACLPQMRCTNGAGTPIKKSAQPSLCMIWHEEREGGRGRQQQLANQAK